MTTLKKVHLSATVEVGIDFYPEDFEIPEDWEKFLLQLGEPAYVVDTLIDNLNDLGSMLRDDVIKQITLENTSWVSFYERDDEI